MLLLQRNIGRLIEARLTPPFARSDFDTAESTMQVHMDAIKGRFVSCADLRYAMTMPREVAEAAEKLIGGEHRRAERAAILLPSGAATLGMQVGRLVRISNMADMHRTFEQPADAIAWLSEVLTEVERARLHAFLDEGAPPVTKR